MTDGYPSLALIIGGAEISGDGRRTEAVLNPSDETVLAEFPHARDDDIDAAIDAARVGFEVWRRKPAIERAAVLHRIADLMLERRVVLARIVTLELGKPLADSLGEIATAAAMFQWHAEEARRSYGRVIPARATGVRQIATREPLGPIAGFSAWNAPGITPSRKIAGALAAGCSIVMKPSEETPASMVAIARIAIEAGVPPGVINVLMGDPAHISQRLLRSPVIRGVTFTGSTTVGKRLASLSVPTMKRMVLELGGHAPVIIFPDVDVEAVARSAVAAKLRNSGQLCTSPTRYYVHESIHDTFVKCFAKIAGAWSIGNPFEDGVKMGPVANARRMAAMEELTQDARDRGVRVAVGGRRLPRKGYYWAPTLLAGIGNDAQAANVEPFGPLGMTTPFSTFDEAISLANRLPFGLAAYAMTNDLHVAHDVAEALESGNVVINHWQVSYPETPFGGFKESGLGTEGGLEGLQAFQNLKFVSQA